MTQLDPKNDAAFLRAPVSAEAALDVEGTLATLLARVSESDRP